MFFLFVNILSHRLLNINFFCPWTHSFIFGSVLVFLHRASSPNFLSVQEIIISVCLCVHTSWAFHNYEAGVCRILAERGFIHEQHRILNRSVLYRGGAQTPCKADFAGTESPAGSRGGQTPTISGGHLSTRDRERDRDRYRVRDKARGRDKIRTDRPRLADMKTSFCQKKSLRSCKRNFPANGSIT